MDAELGAIYRNTYYNSLLNLNFSKKFDGNENTLESSNNLFKLKSGFIKQHSFNRDLEAIIGGRFSFQVNGLAKDFEFNNLKLKGGLIHKNLTTFMNFTTTKNFSLDKINLKLLFTNYENIKLFMESDYRKKIEFNEPEFKYAFGIQYDLSEKSNFKLKWENTFNFDACLSSKINESLTIKVNGNISSRKNDSREVDRMFKCKTGISIIFE